MHFESHGIATGDPQRPFVARITIGTRNKRETMVEFDAPSLAEAQQAADDWLNEYSARLGLGGAELLKPSAMHGRWQRLHDGMPKFPEPREAYCAALERMDEGRAIEEVVDESALLPPTRTRRRGSYPHRTKIVSVVASARAAGIDVAGIRVWPDGSIAAFDSSCNEAEYSRASTSDVADDGSAYDQWKRRKSERSR